MAVYLAYILAFYVAYFLTFLFLIDVYSGIFLACILTLYLPCIYYGVLSGKESDIIPAHILAFYLANILAFYVAYMLPFFVF